MAIDRWDARDGGAYRYVHSNEGGSHGFHGVFHSLAMDNMVQTFEYEGAGPRLARHPGPGGSRQRPDPRQVALHLHVRR